MPNIPHKKKVVVVGCGAAAILLLAALSENSQAPMDIYLIDDNPSVPLGIAYSANHPSFILNVAANRMGAYANRPDDFYHWLNKHPEQWRHLHHDFAAIHFTADDFVPRMIYAEYLRHVFACAIAQLERSQSRVTHLADRVTSVSATDDYVAAAPANIILASGEIIIADSVIFATGNHPSQLDIRNDQHVFYSPYAPKFLQQDWSALNNVAVLGSGLSMVDVVHFIIGQGFNGNFQVFSRHGLVPLEHKFDHSVPAGIRPLEVSASEAQSALRLVRRIRQYVKQNECAGIVWQDSINQLRLQLSSLWADLPERERVRLRKLLPWWNIHRHRIPNWSHAVLDELRREKRLHIKACGVEKIEGVAEGFQFVLMNQSANDELLTVTADKLVMCSGYSPGFKQVQKIAGTLVSAEEKLLQSLVEVGSDFKISATHNLYALGPALSGILFETTAIPETRQQAQKIAVAVANLN